MSLLPRASTAFIAAIKQHTPPLAALFVLQLAFLVVLAFVNVNYQLAMAENIRDIVLPLQSANYDEQDIQRGVDATE